MSAGSAAPTGARDEAQAGSRLFAFGDRELAELAAAHGSPFFAYRASRVRAAVAALRAVLPPRVDLAFAVKANPHPRLLACLAECGTGFDCASLGELQAVAALPVPAAGRPRLFFAGPGKRTAELAAALDLGVRVQAEGWEDLTRLSALAAARGLKLKVNLRVHPLAGMAEDRPILGGVGPSAFGVDEEQVPALLQAAARLPNITIAGLHVFAASNRCDARHLLADWAGVFELAARLTHDHGLTLEQIDLGGGLGVPYAEIDPSLELELLGAGLSRLLRLAPDFHGEVILEPGRFLAAECGVYLTRVVRTKSSRGTQFVVLEGGLNHLARPLLTGQPFPVRRVPELPEAATAAGSLARDERPLQRVTLAGPLCTSLDRLGEVTLPTPQVGDLLAFGMTGAYGATEALTRFLSHPAPREVWVDEQSSVSHERHASGPAPRGDTGRH